MRARVLRVVGLVAGLALLGACDRTKSPTPPVPVPTTQPAAPGSAPAR